MPALLFLPPVVLAYFAIVWAVLRIFTTWDNPTLLKRAGILAAVCNAPLVIGGAVGMVVYILVAVIAMRLLITLCDVSLSAALLSVGAGTAATIAVALALQ
jgi:hypothetical protein